MKASTLWRVRKRGSDMTQALLSAAFAVVVLISVLAMYQVVTLNNNKLAASRLISSIAQETRLIYRNARTFYGFNNAVLIESGVIPSGVSDVTVVEYEGGRRRVDSNIRLPYDGGLSVWASLGGNRFSMGVAFPDSPNGRALCTFLSSGEKGRVINGPMGTEYTIQGQPRCDSSYPAFTVIYER